MKDRAVTRVRAKVDTVAVTTTGDTKIRYSNES